MLGTIVESQQELALDLHPLEESKIQHILAVDDSPDNLLLIEVLLEDIPNYKLDCVSNGAEALSFIDATPPDLILLDVMMPDMDGYEVTKAIRSNKKLPFIPILLLTAHQQAEVVTGLDAGADDFIRKPFQVDELMARVRALLRLKNSIDQQRKIMRQRDDFVARLTHDLRTPIIATNRILEFCRRGTYGQQLDKITPYLSGVIENNDQLLHMVNSLLEVYRHEARRKKLTLVSIDLQDLLQPIVKQLGPLAEDKRLSLSLKCSEAYEQSCRQITGDRIELKRVFTNLIGNSIKFTHTGRIEVSLDYRSGADIDQLKLEKDLNSTQYFVIQVFDTGVGIAPQEMSSIFEWFRPGAHVNSGSGLGLHLSKRIIELHQGYIHIESKLKEYTILQVCLPT